MTQCVYDYVQDNASVVDSLKRKNNLIGNVILMREASDHVWQLHIAVTRKEMLSIIGQLEMSDSNYSFATIFRSFLVEYEDGIVSEVWGCLSTVSYPDNHIFQLI